MANLDVPRNSVDEVYGQIIKDLLTATKDLPVSSDKIRASKFAAKGLLARVYLYKKDYNKAIELSTEVISSKKYSLLDKYDEIFKDKSKESIFEIYFSKTERNRIAEYNFPKSLNGRREVKPSDILLKKYEKGDVRFNKSIAKKGNEYYANKYDDLSLGDDNFIVLRLAEMYLIRAEANTYLQNPDNKPILSDINKIRIRAKLPIVSETSVDKLKVIIENERQIEFAFEGHRWFDLVRTNRAVDVLPNIKSKEQTLFPIPSTEIQTNKHPDMIQNPGY